MKTGTVSGRKGIYTSHSNAICIRAADNLKAAIRGTPFAWSEWAAWDKERSRVFQSDFWDYDGNGGYNLGDWNIDRELIFFARFARYPAWEYLMKMGLGKLLGKYTDKTDREVTVVLNLRGKDVDHIFRTHLTRADKRYLLKGTIDQSGILGMLQQWRRYHQAAGQVLHHKQLHRNRGPAHGGQTDHRPRELEQVAGRVRRLLRTYGPEPHEDLPCLWSGRKPGQALR